MFDKMKKWFKAEQPAEPVKKAKPKQKTLTPKEAATKAGEPYIDIVKVSVDPTDISSGSFELDWNDKFIVNLIKAGYQIKKEDTEAEIVDRWFQAVCRNIALEIYEQDQADPSNRADVRVIQQRDLGNGRTEVS